MPSPVAKECEPIPGYTVKEFLGSGGYGEVWSVAAPGGLTKAIKFVYGQHSEKRAAAELKSLERVRELRHPFLLSLERFEVVDGRLVVVTELADTSLGERFSSCREQGLPGIPRDELLHYLRETADGLDFMMQQHGLQHLDVKPANLLLLAGHIKIADFGLVKDLQNVSLTIVGGLTPVYSPPELFRGRPNDRSDQYSLAVVFQEMLTGTFPFPGTTPAELAVQQIKAKPDLSSLPAADRPVVARALSKEPKDRFATSTEMVEALLGGQKTGLPSQRVHPTVRGAPPRAETSSIAKPVDRAGTSAHTLVCDPDSILPASDTDHELMRCLPPLPRGRDRVLGPITMPETRQSLVPALFCGIGGTAAYVLRHLCRRVNDRFGARSVIPTIKMLLLDTDAETLVSSTSGDDRSALTRDETLALPLRRPLQYRNSAHQMLRWLKRRWLYNMPRSLKTEGLRPLGRLAMVDHAEVLRQTIEQAARSVVETQMIEAASRNSGVNFRSDALRIYLIASVAGGTGSGMVLDVAYALQTILANLDLKEKEVYGILVHSTTRNSPLRDVAVLNTLSWLTEFNHYNRPGGVYPGDETCGLAPVEPGDRAFHRTYLTHLGEDLDQEEFNQATRSVADYVYLDALTSASAFFSGCRNEPDNAPQLLARHAKLRTFGLHSLHCIPDELVETAAAVLCRAVLFRRSGRRPADSGELRDVDAIKRRALDALVATGLDLQGLFEEARSVLEHEISTGEQNLRNEQEFSDALFADYGELEDQQEVRSPGLVSEQCLGEISRQLATSLCDKARCWLIGRIDGQHVTLAQAARLASALSQQFSSVKKEAGAKAKRMAERRRELALQVSSEQETTATISTEGSASVEVDNQQDEVSFNLQKSALDCTTRLAQQLKLEMDRFAEQLTQLAMDLERLAELSAEEPSKRLESHAPNGSDALSQLAQAVARFFHRNQDRLVSELDKALNATLLKERGGFFRVLTGHAQVRAAILSGMRSMARQLVHRAINESDLLRRLFAAGGPEKPSLQLDAYLELAKPHLSRHAGPRRLLAVLPPNLASAGDAPGVLRDLDGKASLTSDTANQLTLCYETDWISLPHVAADLAKHSPRSAEAAVRLHVRCDVNWSSIWHGDWVDGG